MIRTTQIFKIFTILLLNHGSVSFALSTVDKSNFFPQQEKGKNIVNIGPDDSSAKSILSMGPSSLVTKSISQSYPITLLTKLFSSVPKREFAINSICMNSEDSNGITLLIGRSGSGKSTLLRILSGSEVPKSGDVYLNDQLMYSMEEGGVSGNNNKNESTMQIQEFLPKPIILERKHDSCYDDKNPVLDLIIGSGNQALRNSPFFNKDKNDEKLSQQVTKQLAKKISNILQLTDDQLLSPPSNLTPSGLYLFGIACACMESSCNFVNMPSSISSRDDESTSLSLPCPVLLLDELLDKEHPSVVRVVGNGLIRLRNSGGVVMVATHKPDHWNEIQGKTTTLSSGRILTEVSRKGV